METLEDRIERAQRGGPEELALLVHDSAPEVLEALLRNPSLAESHLLTLLARKNLPGEDRKSTRLNSSHIQKSRMPSSA